MKMRSEFNMATEDLDRAEHLHMSREGGCFISNFRGAVIVLFLAVIIVLVGFSVHYYVPCSSKGTVQDDITEQEILQVIDEIKRSHTPDLERKIRLPSTVIPLFYNLKIRPFLNSSSKFQFTGVVQIRVRVNGTNVYKIVMHSHNLNISEDSVTIVTAQKAPFAALVALSQIKEPIVNDTANNDDNSSSNVTESSTTTITPTTEPLGVESFITPPLNETNSTSTSSQLKSNDTELETTEKNDSSTTPEPETTTKTPSTVKPAEIREEPEEVTSKIGTSVNIKRHEYLVDYEKYVIHLEKPLQNDNIYVIEIPFNGVLNEDLEGFYLGSYTEENNTIWYASTQFEATFARRAFPCFDEPALKAKFSISVGRKRHMMSLSNMPLLSSTDMQGEENWVWDNYETTPPMSTYLVAFFVGQFTHLETKSEGTIPVNIWTRKEVVEQTEYSLEIVPKLINFFENYFNMSFPMKKLDIIGVELAAGGMENWGLIALKEEYLLKHKKAESALLKEPIVIVLGHEISHQWIGNLVTMKWWNDAWIKEGLSTYLELLSTEKIDEDWEARDNFLMNNMHVILKFDGYHSTHPISTVVIDPKEISDIFDEVTYIKGACILHMLQTSLTKEVFENGLRIYLDTWKFKNVDQDDLWNAFTIAAKSTDQDNSTNHFANGMTVKQIMDTWTLQAGVPIVHIERNYSSGSATATQIRYLQDNSTDDSLWYIPLSYITAEDQRNFSQSTRFWMKKEKSIVIPNVTEPNGNGTWVLFNVQQSGVYRVNYDPRNWEYLHQALIESPDTFPTLTRSQLVDDALNLAQIGQLNYSTALDFTLYLSKEHHYIPWLSFIEDFKYLDEMLSDSIDYGLLQDYVLKLVSPQYEATKDEAGESESIGRTFIVKLACENAHKECIEWASKLYSEWMNMTNPDKENPIPLVSRGVVYCTAIANGGRNEWQFLWNRLKRMEDSDPVDYTNLLTALACTKSSWLLKRYLVLAVLKEEIKLQHIVHIGYAFKHRPAIAVLFHFIRDNFDALFDAYGQNQFVWQNLIKLAFWRLSTNEQLHQLFVLYEEHSDKLKSSAQLIEEAAERTKARIAWSKKMIPSITSWLKTMKFNT